MAVVPCPHCGKKIDDDGTLAGQVSCPHCRGPFQLSRSAPAPSAATVNCPHCHGPIADNGSLAGSLVGCPHCRGQLWMPGAPRASLPPVLSSVPASLVEAYAAPGIIKTPLLISAIGNIVVALIWLSTCFFFFFAVPCIVLCIFEFMLYAKADTLPPREFVSQAKALAIFEVVVGMLTPSVSCVGSSCS